MPKNPKKPAGKPAGRKPKSKKKKLVSKQMLDLIDSVKKNSKLVNWKKFFSFSVLPENKTIFLWGRYYPLKKKIKPGSSFAYNPLIALFVANKIFVERNKSFTEIALEVSELLSKKFEGNIRVSLKFVSEINRFLDLRSFEETMRKGKHGGRRSKVPDQKRNAILSDLRFSSLTVKEIAEKHGVSINPVYQIGITEGLFNSREARSKVSNKERKTIEFLVKQSGLSFNQIAERTGRSFFTINKISRQAGLDNKSEKKRKKTLAEIEDLVKKGVSRKEIAERKKVDVSTVKNVSHKIGVWRHSLLDSKQAKLGRMLSQNKGKFTAKEIAEKTGYSLANVYALAREMQKTRKKVKFKKS